MLSASAIYSMVEQSPISGGLASGYASTPALVFGSRAEAIHGFNERVDLDSLRRVTQTTALFIADWCGLETR